MFILSNTCTLLGDYPVNYYCIFTQSRLYSNKKTFQKVKRKKFKQRSASLFIDYITVYVCILKFIKKNNREKTPRYQLNIEK